MDNAIGNDNYMNHWNRNSISVDMVGGKVAIAYV